MHAGHCSEYGLRVQMILFGLGLKLMRQHVQKNFGIRIGVDVTQIRNEQLLLQFFGIGQVAIVAEHDAERRIDIERLRFIVVDRGAGGRVADMCNPRIPEQRTHMTRAEHIAHQPVVLVQMKGIPFQRRYAGRVLTAMLQDLQAVIQQLVGR